jgi:hypothetical protein
MGLLVWWSKSVVEQKRQHNQELRGKHRESFDKLLDAHIQLFRNLHSRNQETDTMLASKEILLWASDDVVYHYGLYHQSLGHPDKAVPTIPAEIHFGNSVLAFSRAHLKFKNERLTPELIVLIFRAGWNQNLP